MVWPRVGLWILSVTASAASVTAQAEEAAAACPHTSIQTVGTSGTTTGELECRSGITIRRTGFVYTQHCPVSMTIVPAHHESVSWDRPTRLRESATVRSTETRFECAGVWFWSRCQIRSVRVIASHTLYVVHPCPETQLDASSSHEER